MPFISSGADYKYVKEEQSKLFDNCIVFGAEASAMNALSQQSGCREKSMKYMTHIMNQATQDHSIRDRLRRKHAMKYANKDNKN